MTYSYDLTQYVMCTAFAYPQMKDKHSCPHVINPFDSSQPAFLYCLTIMWNRCSPCFQGVCHLVYINQGTCIYIIFSFYQHLLKTFLSSETSQKCL